MKPRPSQALNPDRWNLFLEAFGDVSPLGSLPTRWMQAVADRFVIFSERNNLIRSRGCTAQFLFLSLPSGADLAPPRKQSKKGLTRFMKARARPAKATLGPCPYPHPHHWKPNAWREQMTFFLWGRPTSLPTRRDASCARRCTQSLKLAKRFLPLG